MRTGSRSWHGIDIVVFGRKPLAPARLETRISDALPNDESRFHSFESYEQALDFCKDEKSVGFFLFLDDQEQPSVADIFRNLSEPYKMSGWPAFGAIVHDDKKSITGIEQLITDRRLLSYIPVHSFDSVSSCAQTMANLWKLFTTATELTLLSEQFRESVLSCANAALPFGSLSFYDQAMTILSSNLNLSWKDEICLRWALPINAARQQNFVMFQPHDELTNLFHEFKVLPAMTQEHIIQLCSDKIQPLHLRLFHVITQLDHQRSLGNLEHMVESLAKQVKPGSSAILKSVQKNTSQLIQISETYRATA